MAHEVVGAGGHQRMLASRHHHVRDVCPEAAERPDQQGRRHDAHPTPAHRSDTGNSTDDQAMRAGFTTNVHSPSRDAQPIGRSVSRMNKPSCRRLVKAARAVGAEASLIVLLGGEAGLRCGEMIALEWADIDLGKRQLCVRRSSWNGHVTTPKGGRLRYIPLTVRLAQALREHRHLRSPLVLCNKNGEALHRRAVIRWVRRAARRAQVEHEGVHVLRHTFCSHLTMRGAPARAIQELAGHVNITTTQRYMHLSPAAIEGAIRLLEQPISRQVSGEDTSSCKNGISKLLI